MDVFEGDISTENRIARVGGTLEELAEQLYHAWTRLVSDPFVEECSSKFVRVSVISSEVLDKVIKCFAVAPDGFCCEDEITFVIESESVLCLAGYGLKAIGNAEHVSMEEDALWLWRDIRKLMDWLLIYEVDIDSPHPPRVSRLPMAKMFALAIVLNISQILRYQMKENAVKRTLERIVCAR